MSDTSSFILSVLTLLIVPGPTNTLLAASGAAVGLRRSLVLIPAECCGYLLSILAVIFILGPLLGDTPILGAGLRIAACLYLLWSAFGLWRGTGLPGEQSDQIGAVAVFFTTLLNPKALIFALVIFPQEAGLPALPYMVTFAGLVCTVALGWITLGTGLASSAPRLLTQDRIGRFAAVALAIFATVLGGSALAAAMA
ncbi:LysE family transporter [Rhizobium sp. 32-5/1]|uniref:LysE family translocator n=1 Tax=Rhizobium sp. 32-5/1 TaxID=3019602 RepID=UPI00240E071C|nr:LysE family transporter [Rhizobium sp. 32-5/1]WEZ82284.1 LysE family transporter [Rhizobium sp. 32-5/1]